MHRRTSGVLVVFFLTVSVVASGQTLIDKVVAVVDKEIITETELAERATFVAMQNRLDPKDAALRQQVLDALIGEKLVLAQALIDSVVVTDDEVTRTLDQQLENLERQWGSKDRLEQAYGKPLSRIRREYRDEMRKQLLVQRVRQTREANLHVTRREVEEFFEAYRDSLPEVPEEYHLSHILIVPKADTSIELQTRQRAAAVHDSLRAGGDFADFARRHSSDGTASTGGDLGWAKRGDYVREFEEAVFALKEGELSDIVKTQFGFHIIKLLERRGESVHARHILFRIEKGASSDSATVDSLRALRQRVLAGESFADLARQYSEDEETKTFGGDLGTLTSDQLDETFAAEVANLKEGEIGQPMRVTFGNVYGFHIVWMRMRTPPHAMTLMGDFRRVEQLALYVKRNKQNTEWLEELKKSIYWEVRF